MIPWYSMYFLICLVILSQTWFVNLVTSKISRLIFGWVAFYLGWFPCTGWTRAHGQTCGAMGARWGWIWDRLICENIYVNTSKRKNKHDDDDDDDDDDGRDHWVQDVSSFTAMWIQSGPPWWLTHDMSSGWSALNVSVLGWSEGEYGMIGLWESLILCFGSRISNDFLV